MRPLYAATREAATEKWWGALLTAGAAASLAATDGTTPLCIAALNRYTTVVGALLKAGAAVEVQDDHGVAPLYAAADRGGTAVVGALLAARTAARAGRADVDGRAPLHAAALRAGATRRRLGGCSRRAPWSTPSTLEGGRPCRQLRVLLATVGALLAAGAAPDLALDDSPTALYVAPWNVFAP